MTRKATNPYISVKENTSVNIDFDRKQKVMTKNKKNCTQITDFETMQALKQLLLVDSHVDIIWAVTSLLDLWKQCSKEKDLCLKLK